MNDTVGGTLFLALIGRYVVLAGNVEAKMLLLTQKLEGLSGRVVTTKPPDWTSLVRLLRKASLGTKLEADVHDAIAGAERSGQFRNTLVHTAWISFTSDQAVGVRTTRREEQLLLTLSRQALETSTHTMETLLHELQDLVSSLNPLSRTSQSDEGTDARWPRDRTDA